MANMKIVNGQACENGEDSVNIEELDLLGNEKGIMTPTNRKLVLHFDIRNTVLVADSITNVSVEQALNSFLTGVTWGREDENGQWQWHSDELSLTAPAAGTMTYYKYLEKQFVKNTNDRTRLRLETGDFTHSKVGERFNDQFMYHLERLRWRHEYSQEIHNPLTMWGLDGKQYNYIVPAVYKCINHLVQTKREFAIVFRTYGLDGPNVIKSLSYGLSGHHPGYPNNLHLAVNETLGEVKRSKTEPIVFKVYPDTGCSEQSQTFTGDRAIYNMLSAKTGISGFRDDVHYWLENGYHHTTAKPHLIDPFDKNVHHIFFDDNIRTYEEDSIVDVRLFETPGAENARSLSDIELAQFDKMCVVQADLIECIDDEDYFIKEIERCEQKYAHFLHRYTKLVRHLSSQ